MKNKCLIIIGRMTFPLVSNAPVNRAYLYCKSLKPFNVRTLIINLESGFDHEERFTYKGKYDGVQFFFAQKKIIKDTSFTKRNLNRLKAIKNTGYIIWKLQRKYDVHVMYFTCGSFNEILLSIWLKLIRIDIIKEQNEIPPYIRKPDNKILLHKISETVHNKCYNKIILISYNLNQYYQDKFCKNQIIRIPILVDLERFKIKNDSLCRSKKILSYVGSMDGNKDGLHCLIDSIHHVVQYRTDIFVQLIGTANPKEMEYLVNRVIEKKLSDFISFFGSVNGSDIPKLLMESDLLLLARPNNIQAKYGFPTKLGEYLASAKPIIITNTGEVPNYLCDQVSAFISKSDSSIDFGKKILEALNNPELALRVGKNGRLIAEQNFNYKNYGEVLLQMIS